MNTAALWIVASFLTVLAVLVSQTNHLELSIYIGIASAVFWFLALLMHHKESKKEGKTLPDAANLIVSKLQHPDLRERSHKKCVLGCSLVNKSGDTIVINKVIALDRKNVPIRITWSNRISELGNPIDPRELIGIKNAETETLFLRANTGEEIEYCKLEIYHSISDKPLIQTFDEYEGW